MTDPLDRFRRDAKALQKSFGTGDAGARERVRAILGAEKHDLKRADFLHIVARENSYISWPAMKEAIETHGLDRAHLLQQLKLAIHNGHTGTAERLLATTPDLADGQFGLMCALYDLEGVQAALERDPSLAVTAIGPWSPLIHLCKSRMHRVLPKAASNAIPIAEALAAAGADVNAGSLEHGAPLSPLYWALGHAGNLSLAGWLLENGATPDDNESLYHATELGHTEGVALLLKHGVTIQGTNALPRAMDFDNLEMVQMLLDAGADPNEGDGGVLHHAALRLSSEDICRALLDAGADQTKFGNGVSVYSAASVYGNAALVRMLEPKDLSKEEMLLAQAASGSVPNGQYIDPARIPPIYLDLVFEIAARPEKANHLKALIDIGMPWDQPNSEGLTPVQIVAWHGRAERMAYFLSLKPDLSHINGYGGSLFSTILHGAGNNPERAKGDYVGCMRLALEAGVALPRKALKVSGPEELMAFLKDWAKAHPGQVVEHGIV